MGNTITDQQITKGLTVFDNIDGKLLTALNSCVHCGLCATSCPVFLATKDEKLTPAHKVDLVASIYKKYCTFSGKLFPGLVSAKAIDDELVEEMVDQLFGACTMCGRCNIHCSIGVDIEYLVRTGRTMLANMDKVPSTLQSTVDSALNTGNNMAIPTEEFVDTLEWLEEDLQDDLEDETAKIPLNEIEKKYLYTLNPREPKFFPLSISAMAKVFHVAKESWTLSTKMYDVTNYAYFSGNPEHAKIIAKRLDDEMEELKAEECVLAECGHGSRSFRWEAPNYLDKKLDYNVLTSVELLAEYLRDGRIKTDPNLIEEVVTLHDPCNLVRGGGVIDEQRYILSKTVKNFVEMTPHGTESFCCGGGGGHLAMSEYNERRMKMGELKAEQIRKTGATIVATPRHNCVDQLIQINHAFKLNVQIKTLAEIVADSIVINSEDKNRIQD
ncbi:MAG: (Fe-S)-binding protein [Bacteroidetes bacterium]|nr:(Fe-S)-binding protein [Bacteroidota bacterium]